MGQDPREIRQGIEQTRADMGETVEALGYKTDVTGRAKGAVADRVDSVRSKISGSTPDSGEVKQGAKRAAGVDEKIGPAADQLKEKVKETGQEAVERGKDVARQAAETAQEAGREHAGELRDNTQERAQDARDREEA